MNSEIKFYLELLKKRLPVMVVIFLLCAGVGVSLAMTMPPKYRAGASLVVEGAEIPNALVMSTVQTQATQELQALRLRLMTRSNLIEIANKFGVFAGRVGMTPDDVVEEMRQMTSFTIDIGGPQQATIMWIEFESGDPQTAANVVNELVTLVLKADASRRTTASGNTLEFFEQRVDSLTERLSRQSAAIVAFEEANKDALPTGLDFRMNRQIAVQQQLNLNARDRTALIEQRNRLEALGGASSSTIPLTPQQQQLATLEGQLRNALSVYSESNPKVRMIRSQIEALQNAGPLGSGGTDDGSRPDTVTTVLQVQLADIDSKIATLDMETERAKAELAKLNDAIERTPGVAIELDKLNREYANTQALYNQAVAARSTAEQGVDVEVSAKGERVALVERASVPEEPSSPNRKLIAGSGLLAGSGLAALFFVLTELLNRTIRRPLDLTRGLGVQPLATIPFIEQQGAIRRRRAVRILVVLAILVAVPVMLWAVNTYVMPLDILVDKLLDRVGL